MATKKDAKKTISDDPQQKAFVSVPGTGILQWNIVISGPALCVTADANDLLS